MNEPSPLAPPGGVVLSVAQQQRKHVNGIRIQAIETRGRTAVAVPCRGIEIRQASIIDASDWFAWAVLGTIV